MRGISYWGSAKDNLYRFNPAYAGNITGTVPASRIRKVQPRVCGEYIINHLSIRHPLGSTPRMRGIFSSERIINRRTRFNPAYAGNMHPQSAPLTASKVQPRVCGEYLRLYMANCKYLGSTPRMRGICNEPFLQIFVSMVQPRVCGEYTKKIMK